MAGTRLGIIMHGVTGRMGMNQHLDRSIPAIRDRGLEFSEANISFGSFDSES